MTIKAGDRIPEGKLGIMTKEGPGSLTTQELFKGKKVVLFSVPGAFTPTCSNSHLPGYIKHAAEIKAKGVDEIACLAVNDVFVMDEWAKANGVGDRILMLADGNGTYTKALGLEFDLSKLGLGIRSRRFSMIVDNGVVKELNVEPDAGVSVSGAGATVCQL